MFGKQDCLQPSQEWVGSSALWPWSGSSVDLSPPLVNPSTIALCQPGCKHGECVGPNKCKCHPGFTGKTCNQGKSRPGTRRRLNILQIEADVMFLFGGKMNDKCCSFTQDANKVRPAICFLQSRLIFFFCPILNKHADKPQWLSTMNVTSISHVNNGNKSGRWQAHCVEDTPITRLLITTCPKSVVRASSLLGCCSGWSF